MTFNGQPIATTIMSFKDSVKFVAEIDEKDFNKEQDGDFEYYAYYVADELLYSIVIDEDSNPTIKAYNNGYLMGQFHSFGLVDFVIPE